MTEKEDYALPLWIGPLLAILCIGLKAGITLLFRGREASGASQPRTAPQDHSTDSAGVHSCSKQAVLLHAEQLDKPLRARPLISGDGPRRAQRTRKRPVATDQEPVTAAVQKSLHFPEAPHTSLAKCCTDHRKAPRPPLRNSLSDTLPALVLNFKL